MDDSIRFDSIFDSVQFNSIRFSIQFDSFDGAKSDFGFELWHCNIIRFVVRHRHWIHIEVHMHMHMHATAIINTKTLC